MRYLTIDEAADEIGVSNWTVSRWQKSGDIASRIFIPETAVSRKKAERASQLQAREQKQQQPERQQSPAPQMSLLDFAVPITPDDKQAALEAAIAKAEQRLLTVIAELREMYATPAGQ
jgi:hypothetical protein